MNTSMDTNSALHFQSSLSSVTLSSSSTANLDMHDLDPYSPLMNHSSSSGSKDQLYEDKRIRRLVRNREAAKRFVIMRESKM